MGKGREEPADTKSVREAVASGVEVTVLDVREPDEREEGHISVAEQVLPEKGAVLRAREEADYELA